MMMMRSIEQKMTILFVVLYGMDAFIIFQTFYDLRDYTPHRILCILLHSIVHQCKVIIQYHILYTFYFACICTRRAYACTMYTTHLHQFPLFILNLHLKLPYVCQLHLMLLLYTETNEFCGISVKYAQHSCTFCIVNNQNW